MPPTERTEQSKQNNILNYCQFEYNYSEMNLGHIAKILIFIGIAIAVLGGILFLLSKVPLLGKLPGDIIIKRENFTFYFPLATSIIASIVLSIILTIIFKFISR